MIRLRGINSNVLVVVSLICITFAPFSYITSSAVSRANPSYILRSIESVLKVNCANWVDPYLPRARYLVLRFYL